MYIYIYKHTYFFTGLTTVLWITNKGALIQLAFLETAFFSYEHIIVFLLRQKQYFSFADKKLVAQT